MSSILEAIAFKGHRHSYVGEEKKVVTQGKLGKKGLVQPGTRIKLSTKRFRYVAQVARPTGYEFNTILGTR